MRMFDFILDMGNYNDRVVGRFDDDRSGLMVSTCRVSDGVHPIETAVKHPDYNDGKMVIVEGYDDPESARAGHEMWVEVMTHDPLPYELIDCRNSELTQVIHSTDMVFPRSSAPAA